LNPIGGGSRNIARYFAQDEVSEFDTREVARQVCPSARPATRLATARPMSMTYYIESCGRADIQVVPLYDRRYMPREGDLIVLEPSRRFLETQQFFDLLSKSDIPRREVHVGPVLASTIYFLNASMPQSEIREQLAINRSQSGVDASSQNPNWAITLNLGPWPLQLRR